MGMQGCGVIHETLKLRTSIFKFKIAYIYTTFDILYRYQRAIVLQGYD